MMSVRPVKERNAVICSGLVTSPTHPEIEPVVILIVLRIQRISCFTSSTVRDTSSVIRVVN